MDYRHIFIRDQVVWVWVVYAEAHKSGSFITGFSLHPLSTHYSVSIQKLTNDRRLNREHKHDKIQFRVIQDGGLKKKQPR
jgi:hypothetical protein